MSNLATRDEQDPKAERAPGSDLFTAFTSTTLLGRLREIVHRGIRFFISAYRRHWAAAPAGVVAAFVSTLGAATLMILVSKITHSTFEARGAISINSVVGPLLAYLLYLAVYYSCMFMMEQRGLRAADGRFDRRLLRKWFRVAGYDYLAHVPSDVYLVFLAGVMQGMLENSGVPIFFAVILSQVVDDLVTFLKEPAIWAGAKEVVAWEERTTRTLLQRVRSIFRAR